MSWASSTCLLNYAEKYNNNYLRHMAYLNQEDFSDSLEKLLEGELKPLHAILCSQQALRSWWDVLVLMQCSGVDKLFGCLCNVRGLMQCSDVYTMFGYLCNVLVLMQCSGFHAIFWHWCNIQVLMHSSGFDVLSRCWRTILRVLMHYSDVDAMLGCWCNVLVLQ